jgi:GNAT superfamily N-acetyltransferase
MAKCEGGTEMVIVKRPGDCASEEIAQFRAMVVKGGEVTSKTLDALIQRAEALAFVTVDKALAGVAGLKNPNPNHKREVFETAGSLELIDGYRFELGWIYVDDGFRNKGYSRQLVAELLPKANNMGVYATSLIDNEPMHRSLAREGFVKVGKSWPSKRKGKFLALFLKDRAG